jgi:uncharacterized protein (TIGR02646 family)
MRPIRRPALSAHANAFLSSRTAKVAKAAAPAAEAERLWGQRNNRAFREVRQALSGMAPGRSRCMYCEDSEGTDIEHFRPKADYPTDAFSWPNYLLACSSCNSNYKRDQFPVDAKGEPLLIDPTAESPFDHLALVPSTGAFVARTTKGRESIRVFGLARETLEEGRKDAWTAIGLLIVGYARLRRAGKRDEAKAVERAIRKSPFDSVLWHLVRVASTPNTVALIDPAWLWALRRYPEILTWAS